ncbi:MAG: ATP-binding protein [bacterium]
MPFLDRVLPRLARVDRERVEGILKRLAEERDSLDGVLNLLSDGIVVIDRDGKICFVNDAAETIFAKERSNLIGKAPVEVTKDANLRGLIEDALHGRVGVLGKEITLESPARDHLSVTMVPIEDGAGAFGGAVFTLRNTTAEMLKQLRYAQFKQLQTFSTMAASIAHEVGNPLNSLDIHLQLIERKIKLLKRKEREPLMELVAVAQEEIKRLEHIITQFLKATRPDVPQMREGDVVAILDKTLNFMEPEIRSRGIRIEKTYAPFVPPLLLNADQIRQVIVNLVRNAIQAMPNGGRITVEVKYARGQVMMSVTDSGCGIPEGQVEKIFDPYFTTREGGAGLGLMIVQRIVSEHGGDVLVATNPGKGTTMTVRLPVPLKYGKMLPGQEQPRRKAD